MNKSIKAPIIKEEAALLKAGDYVLISGIIYTARDAAHKRMQEAINKGESLPFDICSNIIYYMGKRRTDDWIGRSHYSQPDG